MRMRGDFLGRFNRNFVVEGKCWLWKAAIGHNGYGRFTVGKKTVAAHRWAYEQLVGPIPEGLTLDHKCKVRNCVNPDHLEPVTRGENVLRGNTRAAANKAKTHCSRGHELSGDNLYRFSGGRYCKKCKAAWTRKWRDRKSTASPST